ncbi:DUF998 domain-containing protein [Lysobacter tyrosinilyticus]
MPISRFDTRRIGTLSLAAVVLFALVCFTAQIARTDLEWLRAPLSLYLLGDYGWVVKSVYFMLGAALILLGLGYYRALTTSARSGAPLLLFVVAGLALEVTALADSATRPGEYSLEAWVHGLAANTAFLCVTVAMMLQSARLRGDAAWRHRSASAFVLAAICFVALWVHVLWREAPRGLTQKVVIVLILGWLARASIWLRHGGQVEEHGDVALPVGELP